MRVGLAYLAVILLWGTTPLAIQWSGQGGHGFVFPVMLRMLIGTLCLWLLLFMRQTPLVWHRRAIQTYLVITVQVYGSMLAVYWGARFIPSGWISVVFGLTPFITAVLSMLWLKQAKLEGLKLLAYGLGVAGLWVMFHSALEFSLLAVQGMLAILFAAFLQALGSVWVKRIDAKLPAMQLVAGGLLFSLPLYLLTWYGLEEGRWPQELSWRALWSLLYLGLIASTLGFILYYYVLNRLSAISVSLINLVTPVLSLLIGIALNNEPLTPKIVGGTAMILAALILHELKPVFRRVRD